jgi:hypothetical protein
MKLLNNMVASFPPFSCMLFMFWNDLFMMIYYWILDEWWNDDEVFDWILDDCWNDYEMFIEFLMNVKTMSKMLMFWNDLFEVDIYVITLQWILNRFWDVDWAVMNLGCWWMIVWVLRRIYHCIMLKVICYECLFKYCEVSIIVLYIALNCYEFCMSIMKDLPLYYTECNCYEWLYAYYKGFTIVL